VVITEHGNPQGLFQPWSRVQIIVRIVVFADKNNGVKLDRDGGEYGNNKNKVQVAGIKQRIHKKPEAFQALQNRVLADIERSEAMADATIRADIHLYVMVETGVIIQHKSARAACGNK